MASEQTVQKTPQSSFFRGLYLASFHCFASTFVSRPFTRLGGSDCSIKVTFHCSCRPTSHGRALLIWTSTALSPPPLRLGLCSGLEDRVRSRWEHGVLEYTTRLLLRDMTSGVGYKSLLGFAGLFWYHRHMHAAPSINMLLHATGRQWSAITRLPCHKPLFVWTRTWKGIIPLCHSPWHQPAHTVHTYNVHTYACCTSMILHLGTIDAKPVPIAPPPQFTTIRLPGQSKSKGFSFCPPDTAQRF